MNTLHNWDTLNEITLPHGIESVCDISHVEQPAESFTSITYRESEAAGEVFLLPLRVAG